MQDRLLGGLLAGFIAGVVKNVLDFLSFYVFGFAKERLVDWTGAILYGQLPKSLPEQAVALLAHLVWSGLLGVVLAYLMPSLTSRNYVIRGLAYGAGVWFAIYGLTMVFWPKNLTLVVDWETVVSQFLGALAFGLTAAHVLARLENRISGEDRQ